ncbi:MAG: arylesterase [Betaproteobacteria bacterium]|nr:arylesterase [Betaproteobacteria bacterium]MDH4324227.1 arylesterase [Betaproteobacteria bacterium]MDH5210662.1 arylesterase [Betaproteobacteria bacterium]
MCLSFGAWGKTILVYGDSLSAAYGIAAKRGWVALLGERLQRERLDYIVVNASISGETTAGGVSRLPRALAQHKPALVILELGGNDGLRGLPVPAMEKNLAAMIGMSKKAGAKVLLAGMRVPPNYGPEYADDFAAAFRALAQRHRTAFVPFILEGVAEDLRLFQPDRIHPTEAAQPILLENVWKELRPLLR